MKLAFAALMLVSNFAHASQTLEGDAAKAKWEEILQASHMVDNSDGMTVIRFQNTECTLLGSHGGSANERGGESYSCTID